MEESFSQSTSQQLKKELLFVVQGLKGQVLNQSSLAVGLKWKKSLSAENEIKVINANNEEQLKKVCQEMANCQLCQLAKTRQNQVLLLKPSMGRKQVLIMGNTNIEEMVFWMISHTINLLEELLS